MFLVYAQDETKQVSGSPHIIDEGILSNIEVWNDNSSTAVNIITLGNMIIADGVIASC